MMARLCAIALAGAALAGCASGYDGGYDAYPGEAYYDAPYYGGGFGYGSYFDDDFDRYDRYYHPADDVSCDRKRDICYDRFGPSYYATARYLGESEANQAYHKYGDSVFLFSPRPGVSCDRRTKDCSDGQWTRHATRDPLKRLEPGNMGSIGAGSGFDDDLPARRVTPTQRNNDEDTMPRRIAPAVHSSPMADNDGDNDHDAARPVRRVQPQRPAARLNSGDKVQNGGAGNACPPRGCSD